MSVVSNNTDDVVYCAEMTTVGHRCTRKAKSDGLCLFHYNRKLKMGPLLEHDGPTKECTTKKHKSYGSKYPRERIPIEHFYKADKSDQNLYGSCIDCRNHRASIGNNKRNELLKINDEVQKIDPNFRVCFAECHQIKGISIYPRDKVPISKFNLQYKKVETQTLNCDDCRKYLNERSDRLFQKKREEEITTSEDTNSTITTSEDKKDNVIYCTEITIRGNKCTRKARKENLCFEHYNLRLKKGPLLEHDGSTKECSRKNHRSYGSKYPKERVPIEYFYKDDKSAQNLHDSCIDCRNYDKNRNIDKRNNLIQMNEEAQKTDPNFRVCYSDRHDVEGVSTYPRDKVPVSMFNPQSKNAKIQSLSCEDCRNHINNLNKKSRQKKIEKAEKENKFCCLECYNILERDQRALNADGTPSTTCLTCKTKKLNYDKERRIYIKNIYRNIQLEMINSCGASCQRCKSIFLQPEEGTKFAVELPTYEKDGVRHVDYKGKIYITSEFLKEFEKLLELRIIDLDHLTETEQRERGILGPNDTFVGKIENISRMDDEYNMRKEAKKTQNLCCKCHIIITISREAGTYTRKGKFLAKKNYVENLKRLGCSICGFFDENILRYLEMDHIDPKEKIKAIALMIIGSESLEELIEECKKCRILCRSCHRIHTDEQRKEGIL